VNSSTSNSDAAALRGGNGSGSGAYLAWLASAGALWAGLLVLFNWGVDPLQIERPAAYGAVYIDNQRYQNPGIANSQEYETVVIGTSHAENLLPSELERILGKKAVKLAISGSTAYEQRLILEKAIATGKVKRVIWALDRIAFTKPADAVTGDDTDFPFHLYDEGWRALGPYLLSIDTFEQSLAALLGLGHRDLDTLGSWFDRVEFGEPRVMADWQRRGAIFDRVNRTPGMAFTTSIHDVTHSLERNLMPVVRDHPEIRFDVFFPPFSVFAYLADFRQSAHAFADRQGYKRLVVEFAASQPNLDVYDFQAESDITHDLANYKDLDHYGLAVNGFILEAIATGRDRVDPATYDEVLADQARQVEVLRKRVCRPRSLRRELCPRVARR
jgi:hypothetical protein